VVAADPAVTMILDHGGIGGGGGSVAASSNWY